MEIRTNALTALRREIRKSAKQFRHEKDNSESLFHPEYGLVYAYDMKAVEAALNAFEKAVGAEVKQEISQEGTRNTRETSISLATREVIKHG